MAVDPPLAVIGPTNSGITAELHQQFKATALAVRNARAEAYAHLTDVLGRSDGQLAVAASADAKLTVFLEAAKALPPADGLGKRVNFRSFDRFLESTPDSFLEALDPADAATVRQDRTALTTALAPFVDTALRVAQQTSDPRLLTDELRPLFRLREPLQDRTDAAYTLRLALRNKWRMEVEAVEAGRPLPGGRESVFASERNRGARLAAGSRRTQLAAPEAGSVEARKLALLQNSTDHDRFLLQPFILEGRQENNPSITDEAIVQAQQHVVQWLATGSTSAGAHSSMSTEPDFGRRIEAFVWATKKLADTGLTVETQRYDDVIAALATDDEAQWHAQSKRHGRIGELFATGQQYQTGGPPRGVFTVTSEIQAAADLAIAQRAQLDALTDLVKDGRGTIEDQAAAYRDGRDRFRAYTKPFRNNKNVRKAVKAGEVEGVPATTIQWSNMIEAGLAGDMDTVNRIRDNMHARQIEDPVTVFADEAALRYLAGAAHAFGDQLFLAALGAEFQEFYNNAATDELVGELDDDAPLLTGRGPVIVEGVEQEWNVFEANKRYVQLAQLGPQADVLEEAITRIKHGVGTVHRQTVLDHAAVYAGVISEKSQPLLDQRLVALVVQTRGAVTLSQRLNQFAQGAADIQELYPDRQTHVATQADALRASPIVQALHTDEPKHTIFTGRFTTKDGAETTVFDPIPEDAFRSGGERSKVRAELATTPAVPAQTPDLETTAEPDLVKAKGNDNGLV